jgi:two-component system chemotaxis response regulator CheV
MDTKILLENGTNELEILEFTLAGNSYGINVAKIKEIITYQPVTPVPNSHPSIEGIFMPRDTMITAIDLKNCLGRGESEKKGLFIVTNFNKLDIAFHVESVLGIHRVSWRDIIKPDITISAADESVATGIIKKNDKLIIILDFEKIVSDINPETGLKMSELNELGERTRSSVPILIAEDSPLLNKLIVLEISVPIASWSTRWASRRKISSSIRISSRWPPGSMSTTTTPWISSKR